MNFDIIKNEKDKTKIDDYISKKYTDIKSSEIIKSDLEYSVNEKKRNNDVEIVPVEKYLYIDSRNRDIRKYPKASDMVIELDDTVENVRSVELFEIQLPNAVQNIDSNNNNIYWSNISEQIILSCELSKIDNSTALLTFDTDININSRIIIFDCPGFRESENDYEPINVTSRTITINLDMTLFLGISVQANVDIGKPVYNIRIFPGNYTLNSICSQIQNQMNSIRNISGNFHRFLVTPNTETDIINFRQFTTRNLVNNPIQIQTNSTDIKVSIRNHGLAIGDVIALFDTIPVGNFTKSQLDGVHTVKNITNDDITFELNVPSSVTASGGGPNILLGIQVSFKLLFNDKNIDNKSIFNNLIDYNLGFPNENSSVLLNNIPSPNILDVTSVTTNNDIITINTLQNTSNIIFESNSVNIDNIIFNSDSIDIIIQNHNIKNQDVFIISNCFVINIYSSVSIIDRNTLRINIDSIKQNYILTTVFVDGILYYSEHYIELQNINIKSSNIDRFFILPGSLTSNSFQIKTYNTGVDIYDNPKINTKILSLRLEDHGYNNITSIQSINSDFIQITTLLPHNLSGVIISNVIINRTQPDTIDLNINDNIDTQTKIYIESNNINDPNLIGEFIVEQISLNNYRILYEGSDIVSGFVRISYGDRVVIANTNSQPRLRGEFGCQILDSNNFLVTSDGNFLLSSGNSGNLSYSNSITLYRTERNVINSYPNLNQISGFNFDVIIIDKDNINILSNNYSYSNNDKTTINENMYYDNIIAGNNISQSNTEDWRDGENIFRLVQLNGENYVFISCPELSEGDNFQRDIFQKIQLDVDSGAIVFHQGNYRDIKYRPKIKSLNKLTLKLVKYDGNLFDILRLDYSFTLRVVEEKQVVNNTLLHSSLYKVKDYYIDK